MRKRIIFFGLALTALMVSCSNEEPIVEEKQEDFTSLNVLFKEKEFADSSSYRLLKELNICSDVALDEEGKLIAPCAPSNFTFVPLAEGKSLHNGFILIVRADTGGFPLRRVLVFEREGGVLVKVNGYIGNLIGKKKSKTGYDDLLMRFLDKVEGSNVFYNCIMKWEDGKYQFKSVEVIEEPAGNFRGRVKESIKDSVSNEIYQSLIQNQMIF